MTNAKTRAKKQARHAKKAASTPNPRATEKAAAPKAAGAAEAAAVTGPEVLPAAKPERAAQLHPQLEEYPVANSVYKLLRPRDGVAPEDLELEARLQMAQRVEETAGKLPRAVNRQALEVAQEEGRKREERRKEKARERIEDLHRRLGVGEDGSKDGPQSEGDTMKKAKGKKSKGNAKSALAAGLKKVAGAKGKTAKGRPGKGIGAFCSEMLMKKKSTEEIVAAAKKQFPGAKTSPASVAWYRNRLREEGKLPKE